MAKFTLVQEAALATIAGKFSKDGIGEKESKKVDFKVHIQGTISRGEGGVNFKSNPAIDPARVLTFLLATNPELVKEAVIGSEAEEYRELYKKTGEEVVTEFIAGTLGIPHRVPVNRAGSVSSKNLICEIIK